MRKTTAWVAGPIPETSQVGTLVLASYDNFGPMVDAMRAMIWALPRSVDVHLLLAHKDPWGRPLRNPLTDLPPMLRSRVKVTRVPIDSGWVRDYFPEPVRGEDGRLVLRAFAPNNRQTPLANAAGMGIAETMNIPARRSALNIDGGAFVADDTGHVFMTTRVLRDNPPYDAADLLDVLQREISARKITLVPEMPREATGHLDMLAKFVGHKTMVVGSSVVPERGAVLDEIARLMGAAGFRVIRIANADGAGGGTGQPLYSYVNSVLINGVAFVPEYNYPALGVSPLTSALKKSDEAAVAVYRELGFRVVPIPSRNLVTRGGVLHCMTKTLPPLRTRPPVKATSDI